MLPKISGFVKENQGRITLAAYIALIALLFFFLGYIFAKLQEKQPLTIIEGERLIQTQNENS
jgi:hypothetical protein